MEFHQQHYQYNHAIVPSLGHYSYQFPSSSIDQEQYEQGRVSVSSGLSTMVSGQHSVEYNTPIQREAEEPDSSSRPRMTTEQTNILEANFQADQKPVTAEKSKLAQRLGLSLDKVNNWYQNRRAKAKQAAKKVETLCVQMPDTTNMWTYSAFPPPQHQAAEISTNSLQESMDHQIPLPSDSMMSEPSDVNSNVAHFITQQQSTFPQFSMDIQREADKSTAFDSIWNGVDAGPTSWLPYPSAEPTIDYIPSHEEYAQSMRRPFGNHVADRSEVSLAAEPAMEQRHSSLGNLHLSPESCDIKSDGHYMSASADPVSKAGSTGLKMEYGEEMKFNARSENFISSMEHPWESTQPTTNTWVPASFGSPMGDHQLLLQQSALPHFSQPQEGTPISNHADPCGPCQENITRSNAGAISRTSSVAQVVQQSPMASPFVFSSGIQRAENTFSRRNSDSSDLANNLDTIHLQKVQSQQSSDEEVFKTPQLPRMNLATRRKQRRPAQLGSVSMRSHSCTGPQNPSPITKNITLGPSASVRRIKSMGNSLNVKGSRVQKSGVASSQRSPLSVQTFHEAATLTQDEMAGQPTDSSYLTSTNDLPSAPETPSNMSSHGSNWGRQLSHSNSNPSIMQYPSHETSAYDLHDTFASYTNTPVYMGQYQQQTMAPPQSAPAHLTTFPNVSPLYHPGPMTPSSSYFPPQQSSHEAYGQFLGHYQSPMSNGPHYNCPAQASFYNYSNPRIIDSSPVESHHSGFFQAQSAAPTKELEVVMTTFPKPAEEYSAPKEPHRPKQFTFQNSGPGDY